MDTEGQIVVSRDTNKSIVLDVDRRKRELSVQVVDVSEPLYLRFALDLPRIEEALELGLVGQRLDELVFSAY